MAYRLHKQSDSGTSDGSSGVGTPFSGADVITDETELNEDDSEVIEELEDKQLSHRLETIEQENRQLKEVLSKLEHGRSWLEERVDMLEQIMSNRSFSKDIAQNNVSTKQEA